MIYFIDTNIFLRTLINENETQYRHCLNLLKRIKENKIEAVTGSIVLAEAVWTLNSYYKFPKEKILQAIKSIINLRGLKIVDNYQHLLALNLFEKYPVKYIDALIASYPEIQNKIFGIVSYDKDFDKLPILKKEPQEIKN